MSNCFNSIFRQICSFDVSLNHCYFYKLQSNIFGFDVYYGEDEFYKNMHRMHAKKMRKFCLACENISDVSDLTRLDYRQLNKR